MTLRLRRLAVFAPALGLAVILLLSTRGHTQPAAGPGSGSAEAPAEPKAPVEKGPRPQKVFVGIYLKGCVDRSQTTATDRPFYLLFR